MKRTTVLMAILLSAFFHPAYAISVSDLPSQLQGCISSNDCYVDTSGPAASFGSMQAYTFVDNLKSGPTFGYALQYFLLPPSGQDSSYTGHTSYAFSSIWLTVYSSYVLGGNTNPVTVYTDQVSPQPNNLLYDSNGLDISINLQDTALLGGNGYQYQGLDSQNNIIDQANMYLQTDQPGGGTALYACVAEDCLDSALLNLVYLEYVDDGNGNAVLQFNASDPRSLLYRLTHDYNVPQDQGGYQFTQSYYVAAVPLPPAIWLFGSGLLLLARRLFSS